MNAKWYSLWYSGDFRPFDNIWSEWYSRVVAFCEEAGLTITHFGAGGAEFRSGKYLQYRRGKSRLLRALEQDAEFRHLSFLEMQSETFNTLAGDNSFYAVMSSTRIEVDVRLEHHPQQLCDSFRDVAEGFFDEARLITFRTPASIDGITYLPCGLPANYDNPRSRIVDKYLDVESSYVGV